MPGRGLLLAIPSLAVAIVALALFGPGSARPFEAAQIWGGPAGTGTLSWRVVVTDRMRGIDRWAEGCSIRIDAWSGDTTATARCRTREDGCCDVELALDASAGADLRADVLSESGATLASGAVSHNVPGWGTGPRGARIAGSASGDLELTVYALRGVFAAPFRDGLWVRVRSEGRPAEAARVSARADGADLEGAGADGAVERVVSSEGEASFFLVPRTHTVEARVEASHRGRSATWDGILPVMPGAMWLDPSAIAAGKIRVVSPVPRALAYATIATRSARLWGGVVPLATDAAGFASGEIDWPPGSSTGEPQWLTLAADANARGMGTVGWPVVIGRAQPRPQEELAFRDALLLDGMPLAEQRDAARRNRARALAAIALAAAAILEGVLLARVSLAGGARLQAPRGWVGLVIAIATVVFAFAALAVVAMWKIAF